jgi:hypothetical protein
MRQKTLRKRSLLSLPTPTLIATVGKPPGTMVVPLTSLLFLSSALGHRKLRPGRSVRCATCRKWLPVGLQQLVFVFELLPKTLQTLQNQIANVERVEGIGRWLLYYVYTHTIHNDLPIYP